MKLTTIVRDGAWRTVILSARPTSHVPVMIDIGAAVDILVTQSGSGRLHWVSRWEGPWGVWKAPADMIDIVRHGWPAVSALELLERIFWAFARTGDGAAAENALLEPEAVTWQAPLPEPPAYLYLHNNSTVALNFQFTDYGRREILHPRNRPVTAMIGTGEPLFTNDAGYVKTDMEFGFVVGPDAHLLDDETAMDHVFGYTVTTDSRLNAYTTSYNTLSDKQRYQGAAGACMDKACDGYGAFGPVIVTADEVGNPQDLLGHIHCNGVERGRCHTGGYLDPVRDILANLSRMMTVPAGTVVAMGGAAYDGFAVKGDMRRPGQNHVSISFERVGAIHHDLVYPDEPRARQRGPQSPYLHRRRQLGLPSSDMPDLKPGDVPAATRALWAIMYNVGRKHDPDYPAPYLYPRTSLRRAEEPIVLGPAHRDVEISVQLAAVIGTRTQYQVPADKVLDGLLGLALFIGIADLGVLQRGVDDANASSYYFGYFQSRFGDGFNRIAPPVPISELNDKWRDAPMRIEIEGHGAAEGAVSDYDTGVERMIEWISKGVTMLPGDVAALGPGNACVKVPMTGSPGSKWKLRAGIKGLVDIDTHIEDQRDERVGNWHKLKIGPSDLT
ncbi:MAG: hypothetical protein CMJ18_09130 [Phycisphaeraceae bacterium]|nr:hypothetical protein [Phycisphaeraceae bacterium]